MTPSEVIVLARHFGIPPYRIATMDRFSVQVLLAAWRRGVE